MANHPKIDIHAHFYPERFLKLLDEEGESYGVRVHRGSPQGLRIEMEGGTLGPPLAPPIIDLDLRLKEMSRQGVDIHVLSVSRPMVYFADGPLGLKLAQTINDALAEAHLAFPDRFLGFAILPMQDTRLALKELKRCGKLPGIRGVYLGTNVNGRDLDDPKFFPVYRQIEKLELPIFLHPTNVIQTERLKPYYFYNLLGFPFDTALAGAHLIFAGVLDRYPRLTFCLPHAGGVLPYLVGRMNRGQRIWEECRSIKHRPSTYLRRFVYDTISHDPDLLLYLIRQVGTERVMLGSDYCFKIGYDRPVEVITRLASLSPTDQARILGSNAARLLKVG